MKIERIQTGVRMEKRLVNTLNQLATEANQNFGELMEELVLHAFEGNKACAWHPKSLLQIKKIKKAHGLDEDAHALYGFQEKDGAMPVSKEMQEAVKRTSVERVQLGFKMEKRMIKVLKGVAEMDDATLGQVLEEIALHQMEGVDAYFPKTLKKIKLLKDVYGMDYDAHASYQFSEN